MASVTAYYDPTTDQALLGLRYDEMALGADKLAYVVEIALLAEIGMIQPHELTEGDRRRFVSERLERCTIQIVGKRTAALALGALVKKLRESKDHKRTNPPPVHDDVPPAPPALGKGTREDLDRASRSAHAAMPGRGPEPPAPPRQEIPRAKRPDEERDTEEAPRPEVSAKASSSGIPKVQGSGAIPRTAVPTDLYLPASMQPRQPTEMIYARYLRSGRWVPIRVGQLSLKGAALLAGALPRVEDHVDVALSFANHRALVRGKVGKVSSINEASSSGAATFSVQFELDEASRRQLTALLTAARAAKVTIKPPPARSTRRFPVDWPISLGTMRGSVRADAIDISLGGMFIKPGAPLALDTTVSFSAVLDDRGSPIAGRAKVVRQITDADARACGLVAGFGLKLVDMGDTDHQRWTAFLTRIEKRADKRVLVGASPARLAELQSHLAAAGYAVSGGTDPGALVQLAGAEARPVDAAVIDAGWLGLGTSATWVETLFSARNVPCITLHGEARHARVAVDRLLSVS